MRWLYITLVVGLLAICLCSCAPSEPSTPAPSTMEIIEALETKVNEIDIEGLVALFAEDAIIEVTFKDRTFDGIINIEGYWKVRFYTPVTNEFRDIKVDGDTATFTWVEIRPTYTKPWLTNIEVQNGKITYLEWPEDAVSESTELD